MVNAMTKIAIEIGIFVCAACGRVGSDGPQGPEGPAGAAGTLVTSSVEPSSTNCLSGGMRLEFGRDQNGDGMLQANEISPSLTRYVCNGAMGQGTSGTPGQSVTVDAVPPGDPNCP